MKNTDRIWAVVGLGLMAVCLVCMLIGTFAGEAGALMMNVSLIAMAGAGAILLLLGVKRRKEQASQQNDQTDAE